MHYATHVLNGRVRQDKIHLTDHWWVSISPEDAVQAVESDGIDPEKLVYGDQPEHHPRLIHLTDERVNNTWRDLGLRPDGSGLPNSFLSYARRIFIPADFAGSRIFLRLDMTRYHVTVSVNGQQIAQYVGGLEPHRIDITDYVTPGQDTTLLITVGDSGCSAMRPFDTQRFTGNRLPTCKEIENNLVHPVIYGGADRMVKDVQLIALPAVRTEWVFAKPSVRNMTLDYRVHLVNDTDEARTVTVSSCASLADTDETKQLTNKEVMLPAHSSETLAASVEWPDVELWDTDTPTLYQLTTTLHAGKQTLDEHTDTFGFREFWIDGPDFYLNGKKIHLHSSSGHVTSKQDAMPLEEKVHFLRRWKERGNVNHIRIHAKPWDEGWVMAADQVGMLITTETALWTTGFHSFDWEGSEEACYENVRNHFFEALLRRDRNRPSVVIWSLSNEMSPITEHDLENPKMATMTRVFERIMADAEKEDDSRVFQMSSAMDFCGRLPMYNLHYPKSWQNFPDYPRTAYWLEEGFLFPWYGAHRDKMPSWRWRRDKPLFFGEFTCVFGATPDAQATIIGDQAFEQEDFGTEKVNAKLWPMEIAAYRRMDVSGFCAWAAMFHSQYTDPDEELARPQAQAHTDALRPLAILSHCYQTRYMANDDAAFELSMHNDTRRDQCLSASISLESEDSCLAEIDQPGSTFMPATVRNFTARFRLPEVGKPTTLSLRSSLNSSDGKQADEWMCPITVYPRTVEQDLGGHHVFFDPDGRLQRSLRHRGFAGGCFIDELNLPKDCRSLWISFTAGKARRSDFEHARETLLNFVEHGGTLILDHAPAEVLTSLRPHITQAQGYAEPGGRLELTYAFIAAPHHPVIGNRNEDAFSLWGKDGYVARHCLNIPETGNALPLLVAGVDRAGLTASPLLEIRHGRGAILINELELFEKLDEEPLAASLIVDMSTYSSPAPLQSVGVSTGEATLARLREVGVMCENKSINDALVYSVAIIDGERLDDPAKVAVALEQGRTVVVHNPGPQCAKALLERLKLPGNVTTEPMPRHDTLLRHSNLLDGVTNNAFYWPADASKVPPWTAALIDPDRVSARITFEDDQMTYSLTRFGSVVAYPAGAGRLIIDNQRWERDDLEDPARVRRYLVALLTNIGVGLDVGKASNAFMANETAQERRERGSF